MKKKLLSTMFAVASLTSMSYAQTREVSGVVSSSDGSPISGASVSVVGSNMLLKRMDLVDSAFL